MPRVSFPGGSVEASGDEMAAMQVAVKGGRRVGSIGPGDWRAGYAMAAKGAPVECNFRGKPILECPCVFCYAQRWVAAREG